MYVLWLCGRRDSRGLLSGVHYSMRHIMRGAFGVAAVYPLVWHYSSRDAGDLPTTTAAVTPEQRSAEGLPPEQPRAEELESARAGRTVGERLPASLTRDPLAAVEPRAPEPAAARAPAAPQQPSVQQPRDPLAELGQMPELRETLAQAAEIQRHAAKPAELEQALQGLDEDPAKLARLKALADMLVQLPTPRGEAYLPSSGSSATGPAAR